MKTISQKRKQRNKRKIKKKTGYITTQNNKTERENKEGKICNQKGTFGK